MRAQATTPTVTITPTSIRQGGTTSVTVQTTCRSNCGGGNVLVDGTVYLGGANFNSNGMFTFEFEASYQPGPHELTVNYNGGTGVTPGSSGPISFTVINPPAQVVVPTITVSPSSVAAGQAVTIRESPGYSDESGIAHAYINGIYFEPFSYSGTQSLLLPASSFIPGNNTVTISYLGTPDYASYTASVSFQVQGPKGQVYQYTIPQGSGYAANGNILSYTDSVNGDWNLGYDNLNRLAGSSQTVSGATQYGCWSIDSFGNLGQQYTSTQPFAATSPCVPAANGATSETSMTYGNASNRITSGTWRNSKGVFQTGAPVYDAAGNMTDDHQNTYLYDPEGRVCAVQGAGGIVGYLYDAEGQRVAKGTLTSMSCDPTANGFSATNTYVIGPNGGEMTEVDKGTFVHTNVSAGGEMIATLKSDGPHFMLSDWLGTRRVQTDASGNVELTFQSQPFGDQIISSGTGTDATSRHFTGKERDNESGLDYFGARYYGSSMGRWMSPDWSPVPTPIPYANLADPQTLNLYSYTWNNPLSRIDTGGHDPEDSSSMLDMFNNYHGHGFIAPQNAGTQCTPSNCRVTVSILSSRPHQSFWGKVGSAFSGLFSLGTVHAQEEGAEGDFFEAARPPELEPIEPGEMTGLPPRTWNLMTAPGPLGTGSVAQSFAGGQYSEFIVPEGGFGLNAYRVWGGSATLQGGAQGTYYSPFPEVGGLQSLIDNGINPVWGNNGGVVSCVNLAPGTTTYVGISASQGGAWVAGNVQMYVPK